MTAIFERLLIAILAWGALAFGAPYPWAYWPLAAACAALGLTAFWTTRGWRDHRTRRLAIALGAVACAIALQIVYLPHSLVQRLSPALDRFLLEYVVAHHPASLHALSIAPSSTLVALLLYLAFALLLVGLVSVLGRFSLEWLVMQIMGLGMAMAVIGILQKALPFDRYNPVVYGFWSVSPGAQPFGPFANRNHFAGWMLLVLPLVAAYSFAGLSEAVQGTTDFRARIRRLIRVESNRLIQISAGVLLMGAAIALTGSRSGIGGLALAMLALGVFGVQQVKERSARRMMAIYFGLILVGAVGWVGSDRALWRFVETGAESPGRIQAWLDTLQIIRDFPLFGTGLNTYSQAMLVYQTLGRPIMYAQAHNDYLQVAAEGGLLVGVPALIAVGTIVAGIYRRMTIGTDDAATYWIRAGAVAGLIAMAAQSAMEFSLQMPGNTVLFVVLLATALHRRSDARPSTGHGRSAPSRHAHRV